jgi:hypothetical protein
MNGRFSLRILEWIPDLPMSICKANLKQIRDIGRHRHEQVRIEFPKKGGGFISALYTVSVFHPNEDSVIQLFIN